MKVYVKSAMDDVYDTASNFSSMIQQDFSKDVKSKINIDIDVEDLNIKHSQGIMNTYNIVFYIDTPYPKKGSETEFRFNDEFTGYIAGIMSWGDDQCRCQIGIQDNKYSVDELYDSFLNHFCKLFRPASKKRTNSSSKSKNASILNQVKQDEKNFLKQAQNPEFDISKVKVTNVRRNEEYSDYTIDEIVNMMNEGEEQVEDAIYFDFTYTYSPTGISVESQDNYMILDGELVPHFEQYDDTDIAQEIVDELLGYEE